MPCDESIGSITGGADAAAELPERPRERDGPPRGLARILATLVDALFGMLRLAFVLVLVTDPDGGAPLELMRAAPPLDGVTRARELTDALGLPSVVPPPHWSPTSEVRVGDVHLRVASVPLGMNGDGGGVVIAGSHRPDFPADTEGLLMQVAVNEAAMALQQAGVLAMQRRIAADLDERVTRRTSELAAANAALQAEVAERRRADAALRARDHEFRLIIDTIPALAWTARPDGTAEFFNRHYLDFIGFSAEQAAGWGWTAAVHPADLDDLTDAWQRIMRSGQAGEAEARLRRSDGEHRRFLLRANPLRDESGTIVKWYGVNVDIHDWKQTQEELRQSEQEARLIVDSIPAQVAVLGPAGDVRQINRRMAEFFGDSAAALNSWRTGDIVPPDELPRVIATMAHSFETGTPFEMENHLRRFDGVYRWFQIRGTPLMDPDGRAIRWYFLITDMEERRRAEDGLRRSEALLADAQRISATGSFSWRLDTDEITFSEELYRIFEFDADSAVTLEQIAARVHPDDGHALAELIARARGSAGTVEYEFRLLMPDGRVKYTRTRGKVVHHPNAPRECVGAMQDVTERHLSDQALDEARSELARVSKSISVGALTASIAHEVNQPLSGIITNAGTCVRLLTADPPDVTRALETARRTIRDGNRAADVIARLRALFSNRAVSAEVLDLNDAVREVIALLSNDLQRSRVALRTELAGGALAVTGDRVQLQQVILNLMRNACDAMRDVEDRPRHLVIRTEREGPDQARLAVRDAGVGLDPGAVARLFDAFYTTKRDGMGMGLSISRSIIERHGGRLWAASNDGPGATFAFSIPCTPEAGARLS
ncbi:MAG TPA: PAS domain-containing protein [Vicinamibacterales bacterium]|nr:PAS domain-containing protein [Vicinamibacterales bacterium]